VLQVLAAAGGCSVNVTVDWWFTLCIAELYAVCHSVAVHIDQMIYSHKNSI